MTFTHAPDVQERALLLIENLKNVKWQGNHVMMFKLRPYWIRHVCDYNNGTDFIGRVFVRWTVYELTEKKDNVQIEWV